MVLAETEAAMPRGFCSMRRVRNGPLPRRSAVLRAQERVFWRNCPEGRKSRCYLEKTGAPAKSLQQKTISIQHFAISM
jgi:hypothetical protein